MNAKAQRIRAHRLPAGIQRDLDAVVTVQGHGARRSTPGPALLEHVAAAQVVYLPLGHGPTSRALSVLSALMVGLGILGGIGALVAWGGLGWSEGILGMTIGAGVATGLGLGLGLVDAFIRRRRRRGTARYGLVLTPSHLILWRAAWCRVAPRSAVQRFLAAPAAGRTAELVDVIGPDGLERWVVHERQSSELRHVLNRWLNDQRPWVAEAPRRPSPPITLA